MRFSVEILDHIFSFLVSHRATLFACSNDPVLSPIIERQLFYHTVVGFGSGCLGYCFGPDRVSKLVSEKPRILTFVRILEIEVGANYSGYQTSGDLEDEEDEEEEYEEEEEPEEEEEEDEDQEDEGSEDSEDLEDPEDLADSERPVSDLEKELNNFAQTLLQFPLLERITLTTPKRWLWKWPRVFQTALEDRLSLPTVKEVHFVGNQSFPFSLIGKCKNIEDILLAGSFEKPLRKDSAPLQLKSLTLSDISHSISADNLHIKKLQSLKCSESSVDDLPALLEVCSRTLNKLDIDLTYSQYSTNYSFSTGKIDNRPLKDLSPIPPNLQQLVIRAPILVENQIDEEGIFTPKRCWSYLPAIRDIINSFIPSPKHLVLDVNLHLFDFSSNLANVDFSPLAVLGPAALSIPHIDLYVHTDILPSDVTFAQVLAALADYEDVLRAIEMGILVIHAERTAPDYVQD